MAGIGAPCKVSVLTKSLLVTDRPIEAWPGFFRAGTGETDAYPVAIGVYDYGRHIADAASLAQSLILGYVGHEVHVVVDEHEARIVPPVDGVQLQRVANSFGVVGLRLDVLVQVPQQYGGSPAVGTHDTEILVTIAEGAVARISHKPPQYVQVTQYTRDELVSTMEAIFATLQLK